MMKMKGHSSTADGPEPENGRVALTFPRSLTNTYLSMKPIKYLGNFKAYEFNTSGIKSYTNSFLLIEEVTDAYGTIVNLTTLFALIRSRFGL